MHTVLNELGKVARLCCILHAMTSAWQAMQAALRLFRAGCAAFVGVSELDVCPIPVCRPTPIISRSAWRRWQGLVHGMPDQFILASPLLTPRPQRVPARDVLRNCRVFPPLVGGPYRRIRITGRFLVRYLGICAKADWYRTGGLRDPQVASLTFFQPGDLAPCA